MTLSLALIEPFRGLDDIPEKFDSLIESVNNCGICCAFNRRGTLLAIGCFDGKLHFWELASRCISRTINVSVNYAVCSISWSRNCQRLVSASLDNCVCIWQVYTGACLFRCKFPSPILKVSFNPRNDKIIMVCLVKHPAVLMEIDYDDALIDYKVMPLDPINQDYIVTSTFDRRGQFIFTGNSEGNVFITKCPSSFKEIYSLEPISSFKVQAVGSKPASVRDIEFPLKNKTIFAISASDRSIRLFETESAIEAGMNGRCKELRKFQDLINKPMWRKCCFSGDVEAIHICAGSTTQHALHIWETKTGTIKKMLNGINGELLLDVQWHPLRPIIISIANGLVSLWATPTITNWSAFSKDYREIEDNMEYEERESEFDLEDEDNVKDEPLDPDIDFVDVTGANTDVDLLSSDEDELAETLDFIPVTVQDVEQSEMIPPLPVSPKRDPDTKVIEITVETAPNSEIHPLTGSSKRIKYNDIKTPRRKSAKLR